MKKSLMFSGVVLALSLITIPVLAQTDTIEVNTNTRVNTTVKKMAPITAEQIACVGAAVAVREAALGAAVGVHTDALKAAYATRAIELSGAYSNTNTRAVQAGVKVSWADFNKSVRSATSKWKTSKNAAWTAFRTAVKACKASSGISDSANSSSEVSGQ